MLDQMLAGLAREGDADGMDRALDFRLVLADEPAAETVLREFFRLRAVVEERHYLACYRLRRWLETRYVARVQFDRSQPPREVAVRLAAPDFDTLCACCAYAAAGEDQPIAPWTRVRFALAA